MVRPYRPTPELPEHLRELFARFPVDRSLAQDPLSCVRPFATDRRSAEIAGVVASTLAIGNTTAIRGAFDRWAGLVGGDLAGWVEAAGASSDVGALNGFKHRWIRADQIAHLGRKLHDLYGQHDSLEELYLDGRGPVGAFAEGLDGLARALRGPAAGQPAPPGYDHLFPSPLDAGASPCKRLALYVRWMVRPDYPDLGLWTRISPAELRVPLDQHVFWIAYHLGLTQRRTRSWGTVEEVTAALRSVDPADPVKFDFVLCHTGISGDCPKHRDLRVCGPCLVRPDCRLWHGPRRAS